MCFIFTCGTHTFSRLLQDYEHVTCQCQNCGNFSGRVYRRWEWFTFCFVPIIPFSLKPWHEVGCHICNFFQDLKYRPDVASQGGPGGGGGATTMHGGGPGPGGGGGGPAGGGGFGPYGQPPIPMNGFDQGKPPGPPQYGGGGGGGIPQYK